jgi:hypothetical protein
LALLLPGFGDLADGPLSLGDELARPVMVPGRRERSASRATAWVCCPEWVISRALVAKLELLGEVLQVGSGETALRMRLARK